MHGSGVEILDVAQMEAAGRAAAATLAYVRERLAPGVTTAQVDHWVRQHTRLLGGTPSQLGYQGFPASVCTSRNQVVCHGIPRAGERLEDGDILNVDVTTALGGKHGDTSQTFLIGSVSPQARLLVDVARRCRDAGVAVVRPGARLGDIGAAIVETARAAGMGVVADYGGHGIGTHMHQAPHVSHVGRRGAGMRLVEGMAITVEPMITLGRPEVVVLADGWTVVTRDGQWSAQFEHTVVVTRTGHTITTLAPEGAVSCRLTETCR